MLKSYSVAKPIPSSVLHEERATSVLAEDEATRAARVKAAMEDKRIVVLSEWKGERIRFEGRNRERFKKNES